MLPLLHIGPLTIQTPGLILLASLWIGLWQVEKNAHRFAIHPDLLYNLTLIALVSGIIGARLTFAGRNLSAFLASPLSLFSLNPGMFDVLGGLVLAVLAAFIYGQHKRLTLWNSVDALIPVFATLAIGIGLAHLASGDAFGSATSLPWGIYLWGDIRQPTQIYESLLAIGITAVIWPTHSAKGFYNVPGVRFLTFLALTAGARLFLEFFRGDSTYLISTIRTAQVAAWFLLAAVLRMIGKRRTSS